MQKIFSLSYREENLEHARTIIIIYGNNLGWWYTHVWHSGLVFSSTSTIAFVLCLNQNYFPLLRTSALWPQFLPWNANCRPAYLIHGPFSPAVIFLLWVSHKHIFEAAEARLEGRDNDAGHYKLSFDQWRSCPFAILVRLYITLTTNSQCKSGRKHFHTFVYFSENTKLEAPPWNVKTASDKQMADYCTTGEIWATSGRAETGLFAFVCTFFLSVHLASWFFWTPCVFFFRVRATQFSWELLFSLHYTEISGSDTLVLADDDR